MAAANGDAKATKIEVQVLAELATDDELRCTQVFVQVLYEELEPKPRRVITFVYE